MKVTLSLFTLLLAGCHSHLQKWEVTSNGQVVQSGYKDILDDKDEIPYPLDTDPDFKGTLKEIL